MLLAFLPHLSSRLGWVGEEWFRMPQMAEEADSLDRKQRLNTDEFRDPSNAGLSRAYEGLFGATS